jgi:hypothetical protein
VPLSLACLTNYACGPQATPTFETLDLLRALPRAERRGLAPVGEPAEATIDGFGTDVRPSIAVGVPSRIIWRGLRFPKRSLVRTSVGARRGAASTDILFRIGISDDRVYEELARHVVKADTPGWTDVRVDLSRYAGWQWSLFYHPDRRCWNLIFNVSASHGTAPAVEGLWAQPALYTDSAAQRDFLRGPRRPACP